ncbi:P-loop containing nucleoside triphosphate hydrolase protein [Mycena amicta]|nr:P-loop containing nucleoside triphosphate hydrolase protein [Mycena amicta]
MALGLPFQKHVADQPVFAKNMIAVVIDELHCITEWGMDDFRPEYALLRDLGGRLPSGLPILGATATGPKEVLDAVVQNLGLAHDTPRICVSNAKLNVSLSVQVLQQEPKTYADLISLFPHDICDAKDFPQTLIYANERVIAEQIQDFLRDNTPEQMDASKSFEFYHQHIEEDRKRAIEKRLESGELRGVPTTDALGLGYDFCSIMRLILWMKPRTFLSAVQKIGRCVQNPNEQGEAVLYVTKKMFKQCCVETSMLEQEDESEDDASRQSGDEAGIEEALDHEAELEREGDEDEDDLHPRRPRPQGGRGRGKKAKLSFIASRDAEFFTRYISTDKCRRLVWDEFFGNDQKAPSPFAALEGGPCCDNCDPKAFVQERIVLVGGLNRRGQKAASSPELYDAVVSKLDDLRDQILDEHYPGQSFLSGKALIPVVVVDALAKRARRVISVEAVRQQTPWIHAPTYGARVVAAIQAVVARFPDPEQDACDAEAAAREQRRTVVITDPISMSNIKTLSKKSGHYSGVIAYRDAWHLMFRNAQKYNMEESQIYTDSVHLQNIFDRTLYILSHAHSLPGREELTAPSMNPLPVSMTPEPDDDTLLPPVSQLLEQTVYSS